MKNRLPPLALCAAVMLAPVAARGPCLHGQVPKWDDFAPPISGTWDPVVSLGQPSRWWPYFGLGYGVDPSMEVDGAGVTAFLGTARDLFSPVLGILRAAGCTGSCDVRLQGEDKGPGPGPAAPPPGPQGTGPL